MEDATKKCHHCHEIKPHSDFNKCRTGMQGLHNHCRACQKEVRREWYLKNRDSELKKAEQYSKSPQAKLYRQKTWSQRKSVLGPKNNELRRTESARAKARIQRKAWVEIPHNRISTTIRGRIHVALKGAAKNKSTEILLGISFEEFKTYLEAQFQRGMSWSNYGEWHIDHIIPCAHFDLTDAYQQRLCFHYLNMRPLWAKDNIAKGCLLPDLYCDTLAKLKLAVN
jgi:hypothetical protein